MLKREGFYNAFILFLKVGKITHRGSITSGFETGVTGKSGFETGVTGNTRMIEDESNNDYFTPSCMQQHLPEYSSCKETFTAFNSLLVETYYEVTNIAFTPIIRYPVTEHDTINT